jgi:hypothetical protein
MQAFSHLIAFSSEGRSGWLKKLAKQDRSLIGFGYTRLTVRPPAALSQDFKDGKRKENPMTVLFARPARSPHRTSGGWPPYDLVKVVLPRSWKRRRLSEGQSEGPGSGAGAGFSELVTEGPVIVR